MIERLFWTLDQPCNFHLPFWYLNLITLKCARFIKILLATFTMNEMMNPFRGFIKGWVPLGGTPLYGLYRYVRPKGYGFSAILVINRVSILAGFGHFSHK